MLAHLFTLAYYGNTTCVHLLLMGQFPITALREMRLLSSLSHENVVRLEEIVTSAPGEGEEGSGSGVPSTIYMVFEFCDGDLNDVLKAVREGRLRLTPSHLRCFTRQMLEGLYYIHENKIIHRDIKGKSQIAAGLALRVDITSGHPTHHPPITDLPNPHSTHSCQHPGDPRLPRQDRGLGAGPRVGRRGEGALHGQRLHALVPRPGAAHGRGQLHARRRHLVHRVRECGLTYHTVRVLTI